MKPPLTFKQMKLKAIIVISFLLLVVLPMEAQFIHPGILHSTEELDFIKKEVKEGKEPRYTWWNQFTSLAVSRPDYRPTANVRVERGAYNKPNIGGDDFLRDGVAAYSHALQWVVTGNKANAEKAIEILNAWSYSLEVVTGHDTKLLIGMGGYKFCSAAEIIRHTYSDWAEKDQHQFRIMLTEVLYPFIKDFFPAANGNWDASMIATMMSMGVFCDDRAMFDRAVNYFYNGEGNGAIGNYFMESGECQESGRDQGHTQMGMAYMGDACEIGWHQGLDMYGALDNRLFKGFEYTAKYNLGGEVPYEPYVSFQGKYNYLTISKRTNRFHPLYEKVYHHYTVRKGMDMPFTRQIIEANRPEGMVIPSEAKWNFWGSLLYAGLPK